MQRHRRLGRRIQTLVLYFGILSAWTALPLAAQSHHFVYLSSAAAQTISGFEVSPSGSVAPLAGSPFSDGRDPGVLAFHPTGRFLYALNSSENSVSAFAVHPATGALAALNGSPFAVGGMATPKFIAVESSGKFLYVVGTTVIAPSTFTIVSYYSIDAAGIVNPSAEDTALAVVLSPVGIVSKPNDRFLYVVGTTSSNNIAILVLELDPPTGTLSAPPYFNPVAGQFAKSVTLAPGGQFLFIGHGQSQGLIDAYDLPSDGTFGQPRTTFSINGASASPSALAADYSGSYLYAAIPNLGLVGFSVDAMSGVLTPLPGGPFVEPPISPSAVMAGDPVAQFPNLYHEQRAFGIASSGALDELDGSPMPLADNVTGIAAASPVDQLPTDPINPISGPAISLTPSSVPFAEQWVGSVSPSQSVSLVNTGDAPLLLSGIRLTGLHTDDFAASYPGCQVSIDPNEGCAITITFQPIFEGTREASLSIVDNAPGSPHSVALSGTAAMPFSLQADSFTKSVTAGQAAQYDLQIVPAPGFVGTVFLACTGAPEGASCDVPASIVVNGPGPVLFAVNVLTRARSTLVPPMRPTRSPSGHLYLVIIVIIAAGAQIFLLLSLLRTKLCVRRRVRVHGAAAVFLFYVSVVLASCSGAGGPGTAGSAANTSTSSGAPPPATAPGTPAGQYSLTVTATFGAVTESTQLSLSVS